MIGGANLFLHLLVVFDLQSLQLLGELGDQALILLIQDSLMVLHLYPTLLLQLKCTRRLGQRRARQGTADSERCGGMPGAWSARSSQIGSGRGHGRTGDVQVRSKREGSSAGERVIGVAL